MPTVFEGHNKQRIFQEEIFGPLLPVITVESVDEAIAFIRARPKPLAAYLFSSNRRTHRAFTDQISAGGIVINHVLLHSIAPALPFGGVGLSGNHRPAGSFSLDYCAYPVAGMIEKSEAAQVTEGMNWDEQWVR